MTLRKFLVPLLIGMVILAGALAYYFYSQAKQLTDDPQAATQEEVEELVREIGKLIVLPGGETPTVATVSDPERLKDQPFFAQAKTGDKVLLYSTAKKAYLYDPEAKKLVEVAPLNISGSADGTAQVDE